MHWTDEDKEWIKNMDGLFSNLFGPDYCEYEYTEKTKHCVVVPGQFPLIDYQHEEWEKTVPECMSAEISSSTVAKSTAPQQQSSSTVAKSTAPQQQSSSTVAKSTAPQQQSSSTVAKSTAPQQQSSSTAKATALHIFNSSTAHVLQHSNESGPSHQGRPDSVPSCKGMLTLDRLNNLTRGERAALALPKVAYITKDDIELAKGQTEVSNPLLVNIRPPESAVEHALELLSSNKSNTSNGEAMCIDVDRPNDDDEEATVTMGGLGTFTEESVYVFQTMCSLASEAIRVREEQCWFAKSRETVPGLTKVEDALYNSRPKEEIIRQGVCIMDATDFSTLACERYVNGFTMDTVCLKFLEESRPTEVVYLPSFSQAWAKQGAQYFSQMVIPFFANCAVQDAKCILSPFHFATPQHWGLLCFDVAVKTVYFDDGLKLSPPRDTLVVIRNMLRGFELLSHNVIFKEENWNQPKLDLPLPRFNMPQQTTTGEGSASCGIGVILSVRDIIKNGTCLPQFQWKFENMASLRKELMALVLQWKN